MCQRHAGRQNERRENRPVGRGNINDRDSGGQRLRARRLVVVPRGNTRAARLQGARRRQPRAAKAEERDMSIREGDDRRHHRTFNVASPISASTKEMIQKRMTICGSDQPFFSK